MYIKNLTIENIRSFDKLALDFSTGTDVRRFVLILGNNGVGKTTILRSIALGLCDDTSASALLSELAIGDLRRQESDEDPRISVSLVAPGTNTPLTITTTIKRTPSGLQVNVETTPSAFPWQKVFCCGYGNARRPFTYDAYQAYRLVDSVYTLFNYDTGLWSPEVVLSRLERAGVKDDLLARLEDVLELPRGSLVLGDKGIGVYGPWKGELGLYALGDGYSATLGWLADMLGWGLLHYGRSFDVARLQGVVLVDMIERDLHPRWQRNIIKMLRRNFPGIQFIATTHAPMCAIGTSDLSDDECELVALHWRDDHAEAIEDLRPPRSERVDEVLTSLLFNVSSVSGSDLRNSLERFAVLLSRGEAHLDSDEREDLDRLRQELNQKLGMQSFESRLLEFLSVATDENLHRQIGSMSNAELGAGIKFVNTLRELLHIDDHHEKSPSEATRR